MVLKQANFNCSLSAAVVLFVLLLPLLVDYVAAAECPIAVHILGKVQRPMDCGPCP